MDRRQFIKYVEGSQRAVRRFLTALCCGDTDLADDLAQDTFMKAYLASEGFREDSKFTTWIYRIAYNTFLTNRRNCRKYDSLSVAADFRSPERTDKQFDYQALYSALEMLNEVERSAILLHYMQGYAVNEIAEITESTTDAVKQRLLRGRKHLKGLLTKWL